MRATTPVCLVMALLGGCARYESTYEKAVYHYEPIYCYQSLADVTCHRKPNVRDERRLVKLLRTVAPPLPATVGGAARKARSAARRAPLLPRLLPRRGAGSVSAVLAFGGGDAPPAASATREPTPLGPAGALSPER